MDGASWLVRRPDVHVAFPFVPPSTVRVVFLFVWLVQ